jgi:P-type Cu+ transporter
VCGMTVDPVNSKWSSSDDGKIYCFCSEKCPAAFKSEPSRYIVEVPGPGSGS